MYQKLLPILILALALSLSAKAKRRRFRSHLAKLHHHHHHHHKHHGHHTYKQGAQPDVPLEVELARIRQQSEASSFHFKSTSGTVPKDPESSNIATNQTTSVKKTTSVDNTTSVNKTTSAKINIDVGKVNIASSSKTCNGVILETSLILTLASCVYDKSKKQESGIRFKYLGETKVVDKVVANPRWKGGDSTEGDFALLFLAQPVSELKADYMTSLTWSPYAQEDVGESFLGNPEPVTCTTASKQAKGSDVIRRVEHQSITATCPGGGGCLPGTPFYRIVDAANPVVYGLYSGTCTNNILDRGTTASCGSRVSKKDFEFICSTADSEMYISLPSCSSKVLKILDPHYPTIIKTNEAYETLKSVTTNPKAVLFVYVSSDDENFKKIASDFDAIQRLKVVIPMFLIGVVDTSQEGLNFELEKTPFIEFRVRGPFFPYKYDGKFSFQNFTKFMERFGRIGAPSLKHIGTEQYFYDNDDIQKHMNKNLRQVQSFHKVMPGKNKEICDSNAYVSFYSHKKTCHCHPGYVGTGSPGNCKERLTAVKENCHYSVEIEGQTEDKLNDITYKQLVTLTESKNWCNPEKHVFSYVKNQAESVMVADVPLTPNDCIKEVKSIVSKCNTGKVGNSSDGSLHCGKRTFTPVQKPSSANYLKNFLNNDFPDAFKSPPYKYYVYQDWVAGSQNKFSTFFNTKRGTPDITAYKLGSTDMEDLFKGKNRNRAMITSAAHDTKHLYADEIGKGYGIATTLKKDVWKKYEKKIYNYAKTKCHKRGSDAELHLLKGLSDVEILPGRATSILRPRNDWPEFDSDGCQLSSRHFSNIQARSVWAVGCCTWNDGNTTHGESISLWGNNVGEIKPSYEHQPDLPFLASQLYPSATNFTFFPGNPNCDKAANHMAI